jgi:hypothetical protein
MGSLLDNVRRNLFGDPAPPPTNVAPGLAAAGTAFATLIEGVGKAVAKTQAELDATSGHIATEMAKTKIDTVQAVVTEYDDDGSILEVRVVPGKTSALSIAVPPALSFKRVHLEGSFVATEFSAAQHSNVNVNLVSTNVGFRGFFRGFGASGSVTNVNTDIQTEQTQDTSIGAMSMTALIRPKPVTALKKPPLVLRGPKLALSVSGTPSVTNLHPVPTDPATQPPFLERRSTVVKVELKNASGTVINPGKTIAIDCGALDWGMTNEDGTADVATGPVTDNSTGLFHIKVSRTATSETEPKKDFVVRGSLNLVHGTVNVSL